MANEIITGTGLGAALGAKLIYDACGPTAKYLGGELASYTEVGLKNLRRIFEHAAQRSNAQNKVNGQVPPRVLKNILSEGYFCEDELQASYLGGVLASSKGPVPRDDRAVAFCSLISSLSSYQLRTHFILYTAILRTSVLSVQPPGDLETAFCWMRKHGITVCIRESDYLTAMEFFDIEQPLLLAEHSFVGLDKRGLCEGGFNVIHPDQSKNDGVDFRFFYPTTLGIELFLWGHGIGDHGIDSFRPNILEHIALPFSIEPLELHLGRVSWN